MNFEQEQLSAYWFSVICLNKLTASVTEKKTKRFKYFNFTLLILPLNLMYFSKDGKTHIFCGTKRTHERVCGRFMSALR